MPTKMIIRYSRRSSESGDDFSFTSQDEASQHYLKALGVGESIALRQHVTGTIHIRERKTKTDPFELWPLIETRQVEILVQDGEVEWSG